MTKSEEVKDGLEERERVEVSGALVEGEGGRQKIINKQAVSRGEEVAGGWWKRKLRPEELRSYHVPTATEGEKGDTTKAAGV